MFIKKVSIIFIGLLFIGLISCIKNTQNENPYEISEYYKNLIEIGEIKPLYVLKHTDKEKYDIIIRNLPENYIEKDYYYSIDNSYKNISDILYEIQITKQFFTSEGYEKIKNNFSDRKMRFDEYAIWYYEIFLIKNFSLGDSTGKCFTAYFNNEYGFIGKSAWE